MKTNKRVKSVSKPRKGGKVAVNHTVTVQVTTTVQLAHAIDKLVETGFYGNSRATACAILLSQAIRDQIKAGIIQAAKKAMEA